MGPGVAWKFICVACLLRKIMSGVDLELLLNVKKFGPRCSRLHLFRICTRCFPEVLECEEPNLELCAFRSPRKKRGRL